MLTHAVIIVQSITNSSEAMGQTFMYKHTYPVVIGSIYAEIEIIFGTV